MTVLTTDELYPRTLAERYRLYQRRGDELEVLATAPDMAGVGLAIGTLDEDARAAGGRLADGGPVGVLDTCPGGVPSETGDWIVKPWERAL